jgi:glycosyltransferase involved in cell wall biosynthesis
MIKRLLIVIPCFNEQSSIGSLLDELLATSIPDEFLMTILVVNDCSTDRTKDVIEQYKEVRLLDLPFNLGIGGAMQAGYRFAHEGNFDLAVQMDGDGQHPPLELRKLLEQWMNTKANVVIGSRFLKREGYQSSVLRRGGINYLRSLNRLLTNKNINDCTSGFRLFDTAAISLAAKDYPDEYPEPESLVRFSKAGLKTEEVAVVMRKRQGGQSSIRYGSQLYYITKVTIAMFYSFIRKK